MTNPDQVTSDQIVELLKKRNPLMFNALLHEIRADQWKEQALHSESHRLSLVNDKADESGEDEGESVDSAAE